MSLYLGKDTASGSIIHLTKNVETLSTLKSPVPVASTSFHSNMDLFEVLNVTYATYQGTINGGYQFNTPFDLESTYTSNDTNIMVIVVISGVSYLNVPPSMLATYIDNGRTPQYEFVGTTICGYWLTKPSAVIVIRTQKYTPALSSSIKISPTEFKVNGVDFTTKFLCLSSANISGADTSFNTTSTVVYIANSSAATGWFLKNDSFGRVNSDGSLNYFVKKDVSTFTKYRFLASGYNTITLPSGSPSSFLLTIRAIGTEAPWTEKYFTSTFYVTPEYNNGEVHINNLPIGVLTIPLGGDRLFSGFKYTGSQVIGYTGYATTPTRIVDPWNIETAGRIYFKAQAID